MEKEESTLEEEEEEEESFSFDAPRIVFASKFGEGEEEEEERGHPRLLPSLLLVDGYPVSLEDWIVRIEDVNRRGPIGDQRWRRDEEKKKSLLRTSIEDILHAKEIESREMDGCFFFFLHRFVFFFFFFFLLPFFIPVRVDPIFKHKLLYHYIVELSIVEYFDHVVKDLKAGHV